MKAGPDLEQRPDSAVTSAQPELGSVMRERIFRSVVFPAPLCPMSPSTEPRSIVSERSRSAQIVADAADPSRLRGRTIVRAARLMLSRSVS